MKVLGIEVTCPEKTPSFEDILYGRAKVIPSNA